MKMSESAQILKAAKDARRAWARLVEGRKNALGAHEQVRMADAAAATRAADYKEAESKLLALVQGNGRA